DDEAGVLGIDRQAAIGLDYPRDPLYAGENLFGSGVEFPLRRAVGDGQGYRVGPDLALQLRGGAARHDLSVVDDVELPAEPVRFLHILRREEYRNALLLVQLLEVGPYARARLRFETRRRFIQ